MEKINKKSDYSSNIKTFIIVCHSISIITNLILFLIFYMVEHYYKYFALIIHFLLLVTGIISTRFLLRKEQISKNIKKYKSSIKFFAFFIYISFLFYLSLLIYMYIYKYDIDIFYFFVINVGIWGVFHFFLLLVIKSFIKEIIKIKGLYGKAKKEKMNEMV